jgi:dethiobiotin synthetase
VKIPDRLFVTGTDTGVGKTVVSAMLKVGLDAHYWKPIQSGTDEGTDSDWIESVATNPVDLLQTKVIPEIYSLRAPLSPHEAARLEGIRIDLDPIKLPRISPLIVEGAGGVMVPINENKLMLDLIQKFSLPTVVVARSGLGTINHTLLTVEKLLSAGVDVFGVVMNGPRNRANKSAIEHYGNVRVIAEIPELESFSFDVLLDLFNQNFTASVETTFAPDMAATAARSTVTISMTTAASSTDSAVDGGIFATPPGAVSV